MKTRKHVILLVRILAFPAMLSGVMALADGFLPSKSVDEAVVTAKQIRQGKGTTYNIIAQGKLHHFEEVSSKFYSSVTEGSTLKITLTPIFSEWKKVEVMDNGKVTMSERGSDVFWMPVVGFVLLLAGLSFQNEVKWFNLNLIVIGIAEFGGLLLLGKLILVWLGLVEKM